MADSPIATYSDSIEIAAPPAKVWPLVTALERHGEWSTENTGGYWKKGEDGQPGTGKVGEFFVGVNKDGDREWKAQVEIVERDENKSFGFVTGGVAMNFALWRYVLEPSGSGTKLTEEYELRTKTPPMVENGLPAIDERMATNRVSIAATLAGIKAVAEG